MMFVVILWSCCFVILLACDHLALCSLQIDNLLFYSMRVCWNQYSCKALLGNINELKFDLYKWYQLHSLSVVKFWLWCLSQTFDHVVFVVLLTGDHLAPFSLQTDNLLFCYICMSVETNACVQYLSEILNDSNLNFVSCINYSPLVLLIFIIMFVVNSGFTGLWSCHFVVLLILYHSCCSPCNLITYCCSLDVCWNQYVCKILVRNIKWFKFEFYKWY
jgi:hypothetical protein